MTFTDNYGMPGVNLPGSQASFYKVLMASEGRMLLPAGAIVDGVNARDPGNGTDTNVLRGGMILGKITATGLYGASIIDVSQAAIVSGATSITLTAAGAAELVRRIGGAGTFTLTGAPATNGTVASATITYSAVNTATGVVTCTATGAAFEAGSFVGPTDGSQTPKVMIGDTYGLIVTDVSGNGIKQQFPEPLIGGVVDTTKIINYPTAAGSRSAWLKAQLRAGGGQWIFSDDF